MVQAMRVAVACVFLLSAECFRLPSYYRRMTSRKDAVPRDIQFDAGQIEIIRVLGKIDVMIDKQTLEDAKRELERSGDTRLRSLADEGRTTSVRVFEAMIPGGNQCFLKEYLPIGMSFGSRELQTTRKLVTKWNELEKPANVTPPFPILLGSLKTDERIENNEFRVQWSKRFPRTRPPEKGNIWLIFKWDAAAFRSIKTFPPLPQVVEGLDYFRKEERLLKRWRFVRKMIRSGLEALDFIHRAGYCHNSISSESLWMTTTNQQKLDELSLVITNLGTCQKFTELGPQIARDGAMEDMYRLGLVYLELILASFSDDNVGAQTARLRLGKEVNNSILTPIEDRNLSQLSVRELQQVFETLCESDFQTLRLFVTSIDAWKDAVTILEKDQGAAWKLIFKLLARGRLYDDVLDKPIKITGKGLVKENKSLFADTY